MRYKVYLGSTGHSAASGTVICQLKQTNDRDCGRASAALWWLLQQSRVVSNPLQIGIGRRSRVVPNIGAPRRNVGRGAFIHPFVRLDMAVGERHHTPPAM